MSETPVGLVVVDKPAGWTSHDVVARTRRLAGTRKVGHAGTLDPMATGVLLLGVGRATRLLGHLQLADKEYLATMRLGQTTVTDDAEGDLLERADASGVTDDAVRAAVLPLTGDIEQVPTAVSAIKVDGRRSYVRVRAGEDVQLPARPVTVSTFEVTDVRHLEVDGLAVVDVDARVVCSSGTYVRALARDLGAALGVGGHLTMLRRTRVGGFDLDVARTLEELERSWQHVALDDAARAAFPSLDLDDAAAAEVRFGRALADVDLGATGPVALFAPDGTFLALYEQRGGSARAVAVFV
ncbi:tRNA pseudouridine(55) synthase TruB [Aeromicrobium sp. CnD17-E]|uniref:tRNA pseudouridine(55) synthase TruB n=1 Tax=Aeromicrobium sp. CnD17-E TaxID=2954487 RepID=UPI002097E892|nr:tRNA pseudouridine(55) synthase TruB [Aeromicrobium sp. CnD17-E]MCO7240228.1 tRNA pseudouridine(55) synthase TruB [Aeromicrobium sp. CnD17-E]